jgi:pimeloyl-ACP methyl ester carboxylesterase
VTAARSIVVLHGFLGSRRNVATLAARIGERLPALTVVALDLAGHGQAPPLPGGADLGTLAQAALADARALRASEPLAIVGHSLGGRVALRACLLEPAAIAHVTLLDITPSPVKERGDIARVVEALLSAPESAADRDLFRAHFHAAGLDDALTGWLLLNLVRDRDRVRWRIDRPALAALRTRTGAEDLWPAVEGRHAYSLHAIRGALSDIVNEGDARRLEAAGCRVDTVDDAGHFLHVERPADVVERVVRGLR